VSTPIERLLIIEEIRQLKARYFRLMDTKRWEQFAELFTDDLVADMCMASGTYDASGYMVGGRTFAQSVRGHVDTLITVHHGHTPEIEVLSSTSARGIWAMEDKLWKPDGSPSTLPFSKCHGYGHYHESYVCIEGRWLISAIRLSRLLVESC
jgi:hypothetical protein